MTTSTISRTFIGNCVFDILKDTGFQREWDRLYATTSWATIFQERQFVESWYYANQQEITPILLTVFEDDELVGLLALTTSKTNGEFQKDRSMKITGAGKFDAEYQTWIVKDGYNEIFIKNGFEALFNEFPQCKLSLRFIPDPSIIEPLKSLTSIKEKHIVLHKHHRPLMDFALVEEQKLFRKRHLKAKYNRIHRAGQVAFSKVTEIDEFIQILDEILVYLDFRQAAMFNKLPSKSNPNRHKFLIELFKKDLLHVTALKLDGETISSIIGMKGKGWMHLAGLISYSPFHSKHSPGLVHLYMLGKMLQEEGYHKFDLTPGYDGYKERFSTSGDEVVELHLSKNLKYGVKKFLRKNLHNTLVKFDVRPMSFELNMKKKIYLIKEKTKGITKSFFSANETMASYSFPSEDAGLSVKKNSITDLLKYNDRNGLQSRWEFLERAFSLVSRGAEFYSISDGKKLLASIWITSDDEKPSNDESMPSIADSYFHTSFKNNNRAFENYVIESESNRTSSEKPTSHHENS
ncbi:GNAT family N-acetyltransferase [Echinicola strongylocentroti]|nr:GNAT family N-acetyltransferase [Echinicola strongylocentroti]